MKSSYRIVKLGDLLYEFPAKTWLTVYRRLDIRKAWSGTAAAEPGTFAKLPKETLWQAPASEFLSNLDKLHSPGNGGTFILRVIARRMGETIPLHEADSWKKSVSILRAITFRPITR